jgi:predicted methyltransferase
MRLTRFSFVAAAVCGLAFTATAAVPGYAVKALADKNRPATEVSRDVNRKPGELIEFAGIKPGMKVVDLLPGIGQAAYFTRIFSGVVGPQGKVYAYYGTQYDERLKRMTPPMDPDNLGVVFQPNYPNVVALHSHLEQIKTPEPVDLVWTSNNYHDMHNTAYAMDPIKVNAAVFAALKPGGIYLVMDHRAAKGAGLIATSTLHRMDEDLAIKEIESVGFKLVGKSDIHKNPTDDNTKRVFEEGLHDHTDIMVLKFQKPA